MPYARSSDHRICARSDDNAKRSMSGGTGCSSLGLYVHAMSEFVSTQTRNAIYQEVTHSSVQEGKAATAFATLRDLIIPFPCRMKLMRGRCRPPWREHLLRSFVCRHTELRCLRQMRRKICGSPRASGATEVVSSCGTYRRRASGIHRRSPWVVELFVVIVIVNDNNICIANP